MVRYDRIRELRLQHDYTLEELGKKIGVGKGTMKKYENGTIVNIPSDKIEAIADALETTPGYLMDWTENPEITSEEPKSEAITIKTNEARILAQGFDQMPEAERKRALEMAKLIFAAYADLFEEKGKNDDDA